MSGRALGRAAAPHLGLQVGGAHAEAEASLSRERQDKERALAERAEAQAQVAGAMEGVAAQLAHLADLNKGLFYVDPDPKYCRSFADLDFTNFELTLHDLHEFADDYTTRWLQHVRDRGDKHVDEVVRPLANCDPDRDAAAVVAAAKLLQRLTASVANLDYHTMLMADADDGEVDQTQITATSIDPLGEILDNEPRLRRFGATLRQGSPVSYAEGGNAGYGLEHLTAYILEHCERFRQKAEQRDAAAALAATIPSAALVDLRLDYKGESLQWTDDAAATAAGLAVESATRTPLGAGWTRAQRRSSWVRRPNLSC